MKHKLQKIFGAIISDAFLKKDHNRPFIFGINGVDASGKSTFTKFFENYLLGKNYKVQTIHIDDFHNPKSIRYAGDDPAESYFHRSFNLQVVINNLLKPLKEQKAFHTTLRLLDLQTDDYDLKREYIFEKDTVVLFEGVFLFREELVSYLDYKIFIDVPFEIAKERGVQRDADILKSDALERYERKYLTAQKRYLQQYPPLDIADMIINNGDWRNPGIKFSRTLSA